MDKEAKYDPTAVALADAILKAAGSGFQHYMPQTKERIIQAAAEALKADLAEREWLLDNERQHADELAKYLRNINEGVSMPDDDVQRAIWHVTHAALETHKARRQGKTESPAHE